MPTNHDAALAYASAGWLVFPLHHILPTGACSCGTRCSDPGKHPRVPWKDNATTDADQIDRWWSKWPDANIGVVTGPDSGIWVLDLDNKKSVDIGDGLLIGQGTHSLRVLEDMYGSLPETLTQITGSGGQHFVFAYPDTDQPYGNRAALVPGVDVRGAGGYIVAPPSNHKSGARYTWVDPATPLAAPPDWLLNLAKTERRATVLTSGEVVKEGGRNDYLYRLGAKLRGEKDLSYLELLGALLIHNKEECDPPLEEDEVVRIAQNVDRLPANEPEPVIMLPTGGARSDEPDDATMAPGDDLAVSLHELLSRHIPAPPALVHGLIDGGTGVLVAGPPNVGKSWIVFALALAVATGTPFLGYQTEQAPVLIIDEEGTDWGDQGRFRMMVEGLEITDTGPIPLHLAIGKRFKLDTQRGLDAVRRMCERYRPKLIIIDSLVRVTSGDENKSRDMEQFFSIARMIQRNTGAAVVFVHHVRKKSKDDDFDLGDLIRGSSEIRAFFDTILIAQENVEGVELHVNKQRWRKKQPPALYRIDVVEDEKVTIEFVQELAGSTNPRDVTSTRNYITRKVAELADAGEVVTAEGIAGATGRSITSARSHLQVLATPPNGPLESYPVLAGDRGRSTVAYRLRERAHVERTQGVLELDTAEE